ncbi:hypothetical protein TNCV_704011 [Trichonephila clavipes]|nr:hypothetical protein TNCV_704011 [Trichonephila clavipes]
MAPEGYALTTMTAQRTQDFVTRMIVLVGRYLSHGSSKDNRHKKLNIIYWYAQKRYYIVNFLTENNEFTWEKNDGARMTDVGVHKGLIHYLSTSRVLNDKIDETTDLLDFQKSKVATKEGALISETARLLGWPCAVIGSSYKKWMMKRQVS